MGRIRINAESITARFAGGTLERIKAASRPGEPIADFIRCAVLAELDRRGAAGAVAQSDAD